MKKKIRLLPLVITPFLLTSCGKAIKYEDISDEDLESIMTKFNEIYEKSEAYSKLESMMGSNTSYIDDTTTTDDDWNFTFDSSLEG